MLISDRFNRFKRIQAKKELLSSANQSDLQNTKSLRISPNDRSSLAQLARTESKRMYAKAARDAGPTFQDKFAASGGADALASMKKILGMK